MMRRKRRREGGKRRVNGREKGRGKRRRDRVGREEGISVWVEEEEDEREEGEGEGQAEEGKEGEDREAIIRLGTLLLLVVDKGVEGEECKAVWE